MWYMGQINGFEWEAKIYKETGISKLYLEKNGNLVVHYEREWDIRPTTALEWQTVKEIRKIANSIRANMAA